MHLSEWTIGSSVKEITVGLKVESVILRDPNARYHVEPRCMPYVPIIAFVAVAGSDTNVSA